MFSRHGSDPSPNPQCDRILFIIIMPQFLFHDTGTLACVIGWRQTNNMWLLMSTSLYEAISTRKAHLYCTMGSSAIPSDFIPVDPQTRQCCGRAQSCLEWLTSNEVVHKRSQVLSVQESFLHRRQLWFRALQLYMYTSGTLLTSSCFSSRNFSCALYSE